MRTLVLGCVLINSVTGGGCTCTSSDGEVVFFYPGELTAKDVTVVRWRGSLFEADPNGAGTGVLVRRSLTDVPARARVHSTDYCDIVKNPIYDSEEGLSPIQLTTSKQNVTATYVGDRFEITGLVADSAYAAGPDELTVSHAESGTTVTVAAPAPLDDPNAILGERMGLGTEFSLPADSFDTAVVIVNGTVGADSYEVTCAYPYDAFRASGGRVSMDLLQEAARTYLETMQYTPVNVILSVDNELFTDMFFPGFEALPVRAGRAFSIPAADLTPATPGDCSFPMVVSIDSFTNTGKLCFEPSPTVSNCMVTSGDCEGFATYFEFQMPATDDRRLRGGPGLQVSTTTAGTLNQPSNGVDALPDATTVTVEAFDFNSTKFTVMFGFQGVDVDVLSLSRQ